DRGGRVGGGRDPRWQEGRARRGGGTRLEGGRERLAFGAGSMVAGRGRVAAALARAAKPTFATAAIAEPRDWGYGGLVAFTAVLMLRPQGNFSFLDPFHLAEVTPVVRIAPLLIHRLTKRLPVFRVTPETTALFVFGLVLFFTAPFSVWPGGALDVAVNAYLKIVIVFVLMTNTLTTPKRIDRLIFLIVLCFGYV